MHPAGIISLPGHAAGPRRTEQVGRKTNRRGCSGGVIPEGTPPARGAGDSPWSVERLAGLSGSPLCPRQVFTRYGKCYTFNSGRDGRPRLKTMKSGTGNGLEIMLDIQQDEYLPVWGETGMLPLSLPHPMAPGRGLCRGLPGSAVDLRPGVGSPCCLPASRCLHLPLYLPAALTFPCLPLPGSVTLQGNQPSLSICGRHSFYK